MRYFAEFTLEDGTEIEADSYQEALGKAKKEAERLYGRVVASEIHINIEENE